MRVGKVHRPELALEFGLPNLVEKKENIWRYSLSIASSSMSYCNIVIPRYASGILLPGCLHRKRDNSIVDHLGISVVKRYDMSKNASILSIDNFQIRLP